MDRERVNHAFITFSFNYWYSLYMGVRLSSLSSLQHVQSTAARFLAGSRKHDRISPIADSLHWLPVLPEFFLKLYYLFLKHSLVWPHLSIQRFNSLDPTTQVL